MSDASTHLGWVIVANITRDPRDDQRHHGTRLLAPGAKVYLGQAFWGDAADRITVTGRHRQSKRFLTSAIPLTLCRNLRVQALYSPTLADRLRTENGQLLATEREAMDMLDRLKLAQTHQA